MTRLKIIYGQDEIKTLQPKVKKILQKIDEHDLPLHRLGANIPFITDIIHDFKVTAETSTGTAYIDKKQVIKIAYLTRKPPALKYRIPTLIYSTDEPLDWSSAFVVLIQPRVRMVDEDDVEEVKRAMKHFKNMFRTTDAASANIGIYRKQFKLVDW